ncbi:MAG: hypothetical protein J7L51_04100 [Desulfurococcales archaeon]|nr:hypothetical protein [Desulfurococcales archaeon]
MNEEVEEVEKEIIELLSREKRPLTTEHICSKLNISKSLASSALYNLLKRGVVKRVYAEGYDPTRPFDTAAWVLKEEIRSAEDVLRAREGVEEIKLRYTKLVLSIPLSMLSLRTDLLNRYEALDLHDAYTHVIEMARRELKIMCPIIDAYALYPLVTKMLSSKELKIKILTELGKSKDIIYLLESLESRSIEIRNVERIARYEGYERKAFGIHAKLIIADNEVALIGSFNLSRHHYLVNFDIGFLIYDPTVVSKLSSIFDELWNYVSANN